MDEASFGNRDFTLTAVDRGGTEMGIVGGILKEWRAIILFDTILPLPLHFCCLRAWDFEK